MYRECPKFFMGMILGFSEKSSFAYLCRTMKKFAVFFLFFSIAAGAQEEKLKLYLSKDSSFYFRSTFCLQTWVRYNQNNPGSTVFGKFQEESFDVGIRRARIQFMGKLHKRAFLYLQLGINNFNSIGARKPSFFLHDATADFTVVEKFLTVGSGLSGWSGFSRYATPSVATTLAADAPLFQQVTNDVTDQFLRKLSVYAKGKLSRLDYRFALSKPLPVQTALSVIDTTLKTSATFNPDPPKLRTQGYVSLQVFEKESNLLPYTTGTYLGRKKVLTIGTGIIYQPEAMRYMDAIGAKKYVPMQLLAADVFFEYPFSKEKRNAITFYGGFFSLDLGPSYYRNLGVMNVANGTSGLFSLNGPGNAFPMVGTGEVIYTQAAYLFRKDLLKDLGTLQPYFSFFSANYEGFRDPVTVYEGGINWLVDENRVKFSLNWQSRPVFFTDVTGEKREDRGQRKNMIYLQLQYFLQ